MDSLGPHLVGSLGLRSVGSLGPRSAGSHPARRTQGAAARSVDQRTSFYIMGIHHGVVNIILLSVEINKTFHLAVYKSSVTSKLFIINHYSLQTVDM